MPSADFLDTDTALALPYSKYGQWFLKNWPQLQLTDTVYEELTGPRQEDTETRPAAVRAERLLGANEHVADAGIETDDCLVRSLRDESDWLGYGEAGIYAAVLGTRRVQRVFYFDTDVPAVVREASGEGIDRPDLFLVSEVFTLLAELSDEATTLDPRREVCKLAAGRDWTDTTTLRRLFQSPAIIPRDEFDEALLLHDIEQCSHDLSTA